MRYIYLLTGLALFCYCSSQKAVSTNNKGADTLVRLLAWGLPNFNTIATESEIAGKWGFYYDVVGNCTVSQEEIDSFNAYNKIAEKALIAKHGKRWELRYNKDLEDALATPEQSCMFLQVQPALHNLSDSLSGRGDTLFYHFTPTRKRGVYDVDMVGWHREGVKKEWVSFLQYRSYYHKYTATLKRKTIKTDTAFLHNNLYFSYMMRRPVPR